MDEETLLKGLYSKDPQAIEFVIHTYRQFVFTIIYKILWKKGMPEDIEECTSDIFIKLWKHPELYIPEKGTLKNYLGSAAKNRAIDKYRQLSKMDSCEISESICIDREDLQDMVVKKELYQQLYDAIETLNERDREIIIRRYFFNETPSVIAEKTSLSGKQIENILYQSKLKLRNIIESFK